MRVRLAPSPTGSLHIGTARTAVFNWLFTKNQNGDFLLRIEDTDKERSKKEHLDNIIEGLQWLGLHWDEPPIIQSERIQEHRKAINFLLKKGLAYRCFATEDELETMRNEQQKNSQAPRYDNRGRYLNKIEEEKFIQQGKSSVIRFRIEDDQIIKWNDLVRGNMEWRGKDLGGDMVISRRAKGLEIGDPLYNLVVVVDDSAMEISHVIRGEDHISNTAKQILLYEALNLQTPTFAHTPLILNNEGKKLSKRDGVTSISDFKEMGYTSEALSNYMTLLGWSPPDGVGERFDLNKAKEVFNFDRVNKAGAKFDWEKLNWINSQVIHQWSEEKLFECINQYWEKKCWEIPSKEWGLALTKLIGPSLILLKDSIDQAEPFFEEPVLLDDAIKQINSDGAKKALETVLVQLEQTPWDGIDIAKAKNIIEKSMALAEVKKGLIMKTLRAAFLGQLKGPDLLTTWSLLATKDEDRKRIRRCL